MGGFRLAVVGGQWVHYLLARPQTELGWSSEPAVGAAVWREHVRIRKLI
jgi:hypothetical protein